MIDVYFVILELEYSILILFLESDIKSHKVEIFKWKTSFLVGDINKFFLSYKLNLDYLESHIKVEGY